MSMRTFLDVEEFFCSVYEEDRGKNLRNLLEAYLRMELERSDAE